MAYAIDYKVFVTYQQLLNTVIVFFSLQSYSFNNSNSKS